MIPYVYTEREGAGLHQLLKSSLHLFHPGTHKKHRENIKRNLKSPSLDSEDKIKAQIAKEMYRKQRKDIGPYQHIESGEDYAVYRKQNRYLLGFKGTSEWKDLLPDAHILSGYQDRHSSFQRADTLYKHLKDKYGGEWETVGHSLGGTKAMYVAERNQISSHAFNPGFVAATDDVLNPAYENHFVYLTRGDPVSNSILTKNLQHIKVQSPKSVNPFVNHSIDSFQ